MNIFENKRASGGRILHTIITGTFLASMIFTIGRHLVAFDKADAVQPTAAPLAMAQADTTDMAAAALVRFASLSCSGSHFPF